MRSLSVLLLFAIAVRADEKPREPAITPEDRAHWSYVKPVRSTKHSTIDGFVREKLAEKILDLSPEADKLTLIRRVSFDLTGLPPTIAEIDAFVKDTSPNAYEKVVDRLLASPHFGERWAQHWLDAVRFAESNGYELDADRPHAWRYRDYVVKSFNDDKPYKTFLREQIAGDELAAGKDPRTVAELLIATGMHRCGPSHMVSGNLDKEMIRQEYLTEMVNGIGSAVLGITLGCARCHNHKTDPISTADYYRVQAFFAAAKYTEVSLATNEEKAAYDKAKAEIARRLAPIKKQIEAIDAPVRAKVTAAKRAALAPKYREALDIDPKKRTPEQQKLVKDIQPVIKVSWDDVLNAMPAAEKAKRDALRQQQFAIEADAPQLPAATWSLADEPNRPTTFIRPRGDWSRQGAAVTMNVPRVLAPEKFEPKSRVEFADWLTSNDQPLTARVIVNRLWHHYFGKGIVRTVADFGLTGEKPTHPELLDWLATDLMRNDWKLKRIHKMIVMSKTYRQSSVGTPNAADPDNRLLGKQNRKRLEAEAIRDAMLAASGELNRAVGGPGVRVPLEPEVYDLIFTEGEPDGLWTVTKDPKQHVRRSIYLFAKRNVRLPLFEAFDQPDTLTPCTGRNVSTFAPQALILMNGPFARDRSLALATALVAESKDEAARLSSLYRRAVGRAPTPAEHATLAEFLKVQTVDAMARMPADAAVRTALADACRAVLNSNEFVYLK
ncbi:MAG: DUF1553 domain-containing protein [Planctomycetia bacterium]|nr:DUF1553 domain-containing protein [Planctomycetia bacterium]